MVRKEVASRNMEPCKIESLAVKIVQESAESYVVSLFEAANYCAIHANRKTVQPKDFRLVEKIRETRLPW